MSIGGVILLGGIIAGGFIAYNRKKKARSTTPATDEKKGDPNIPLQTISNDKAMQNENNNHNNDSSSSSSTKGMSEKNSKSPSRQVATPTESSKGTTNKTKAEDDLPMIPENSILIKKQIGKGNYGTVYYGLWQATPVALKVTYT